MLRPPIVQATPQCAQPHPLCLSVFKTRIQITLNPVIAQHNSSGYNGSGFNGQNLARPPLHRFGFGHTGSLPRINMSTLALNFKSISPHIYLSIRIWPQDVMQLGQSEVKAELGVLGWVVLLNVGGFQSINFSLLNRYIEIQSFISVIKYVIRLTVTHHNTHTIKQSFNTYSSE